MDNPIQALILNRHRYGETSLILRLFTERFGLISAIMKGALTAKRWIPESGMIIQTTLQRRGESGLFMLTRTDPEYHYQFSDSLLKTAVRDCAFELALAILHEEDPHPQLYELFGKFLHHLEPATDHQSLFALWLFAIRLAELLGTPVERTTCVHCFGSLAEGGELVPESGGFSCYRCRPKKSALFSAPLISLLAHGTPSPDQLLPSLTAHDKIGITTLLIENLRSHFEFHRSIHTLDFLKELL